MELRTTVKCAKKRRMLKHFLPQYVIRMVRAREKKTEKNKINRERIYADHVFYYFNFYIANVTVSFVFSISKISF